MGKKGKGEVEKEGERESKGRKEGGMFTYVIVVRDPNNPSASSNTRMASEWRASSNMASMFFVLSPTHLLSSSPQFTT